MSAVSRFRRFRTAKAKLDQACTGNSNIIPGLITLIFYSFHGLVAIFTCEKKMNSSRKFRTNSTASGQYPGTATDLQGK